MDRRKSLKLSLNSIYGTLKKNNAITVFLFLMISSTVIYTVYLLLSEGAATKNLFAYSAGFGGDMFMDFYNSMRDVANTDITYTARHVIYPPMANFIFLVFSRLANRAYTGTEFWERKNWVLYPDVMFLNFVFLCTAIVAIYALFSDKVKTSNRLKFLIGVFSVLNVPIIYTLERGNIILYSVIGLAFYAFFYDSESKLLRELSLIGLAFSFSIKLYPVIFGWRLLSDSRYKDAARCAVYGVLMLVLPSFFFGGPKCILQMLSNMTSFSPALPNSLLSNLIGANAAAVISDIFLIVGVAVFILFSLFIKDISKLITVGMSVLIFFPSFSIFYSWTFMLIPIFIMLSRKSIKGFDWFYFIPAIIPFMFFPGLLVENYRALTNVVALIPIAASAAELICTLIRSHKEKRSVNLL